MAMSAASTMTMTMRIPQTMKDKLDALTRCTGRNRNTLVQEALRRFIELQRWQFAEIEAGIREADAGIFVSDEDMGAMWAEFGGCRKTSSHPPGNQTMRALLREPH